MPHNYSSYRMYICGQNPPPFIMGRGYNIWKINKVCRSQIWWHSQITTNCGGVCLEAAAAAAPAATAAPAASAF